MCVDWKNSSKKNCPIDWRLSASGKILFLVTQGGQFRAYLEPIGPPQHYRIEGFKKGPQLVPHYADRRQSLGQQMLERWEKMA